jgi:F-type H+-transporting ATPase subunit c
MLKIAKTAALALAFVLFVQAAASAQTTFNATTADDAARVSAAAAPKGAFSDTRALGVGLVIIGAGMGIGLLTRSAVESMARQPEMAGNIQTAMIISAALIEGVSFFALIIIGFILSAY